MATYALRDNVYGDGYESPSMLSGSSTSIVDKNDGTTGSTGSIDNSKVFKIVANGLFGETNVGKLINYFSNIDSSDSVFDKFFKGFQSGLGGIGSFVPTIVKDRWANNSASTINKISDVGENIVTGNFDGALDAISNNDDVEDGEDANSLNNWDEIANGVYSNADSVMKFNHDEAELDRQFQERMARNQYTYAMEDLKNAGLNPVLAVNGLSGASASGSSASASTSTANTTGLDIAKIALIGKIISSVIGSSGKTNITKVFNYKK